MCQLLWNKSTEVLFFIHTNLESVRPVGEAAVHSARRYLKLCRLITSYQIRSDSSLIKVDKPQPYKHIKQ